MATFAQRFSEALTLRKMRQSDIVSATGIGKSSISTYLSGEYVPKQTNLHLIAKVLNVNESWLMGYDVPADRTSPNPIPGAGASQEDPQREELHQVINDLDQDTVAKLLELALLWQANQHKK